MIPNPEEYPERYQRYIDNVQETNIFSAFRGQLATTESFLSSVSEEQSLFRYEEDKWSIREVVGHIIDVERVFSLRVLRFSRGDTQHRSDFDFNKTVYVREGRYHRRALASTTTELLSQRRANLIMFESLTSEQLALFGKANNDDLSVLGLLYVILGHERHHLKAVKALYLGETLKFSSCVFYAVQ